MKKKPEKKQRLDAKCWKGYRKSGTKVKAGTRVNNCLKIKKTYRLTEDGGRQNLYAIEPKMYIDEGSIPHNEKAERLNGRLAMLGVMAALGAYALTGQIIPGIW